MTVTYLVPVSEYQADAFLTHGFDLIAGFAVDAAKVAEVTEVSDLLDLLQLRFPDSPFADDKPLDVLHMPADAFVQARRAVGPLHPQAFNGGVIDFAPYDGSGRARAGDLSTNLLLLDPSRVTAGTRLWRFHPGNPEPELRGIYHGITYGWENVATDQFVAAAPNPYAGAVVKRSWGDIPCDVELDNDKPAAITMVAPFEPTEEEGFEQLPNNLWAKRIACDENTQIYTQLLICQLSGIPVRVLQAASGDNKERTYQVVSLLSDAPYCSSVNFQRWAGGTYTALVSPDILENQRRQEATPVSWSVADRPAVTTARQEPFNVNDQNTLVQEAFNLLGQTTVPSWQELFLRVQIVGDQIIYEANGKLDEERGIRLKVIPTAILHYLRQLKKLRVADGEEPFFTIVLQAVKGGKGSVSLNAKAEPPYADQVPITEWRKELALFSATAHEAPQWLVDRVAAGSKSGSGLTSNSETSSDTSKTPDAQTSLGAHIVAISE